MEVNKSVTYYLVKLAAQKGYTSKLKKKKTVTIVKKKKKMTNWEEE